MFSINNHMIDIWTVAQDRYRDKTKHRSTHRRGIAETYAHVGNYPMCRSPFLMGANDDCRRAARITFNFWLGATAVDQHNQVFCKSASGMCCGFGIAWNVT